MSDAAWIQTRSDRAYRYDGTGGPLDYGPDVAVPLSRIVRFLGHTTSPWSVAAHCTAGSVLAERALGDRALALAFLHHEDGEALVGDVPSPLKGLLPGFLDLEARAMAAGWAAAGLPPGFVAARAEGVKRLDLVMLRAERLVLQGPAPGSWGPDDGTDDALVQRAQVLVAHAVYQGAGWGARALADFNERREELMEVTRC